MTSPLAATATVTGTAFDVISGKLETESQANLKLVKGRGFLSSGQYNQLTLISKLIKPPIKNIFSLEP